MSRVRLLVLLVGVVAMPTALTAQSPDAASQVPLKASGNEPGWTLDIGPDRLTLITDYGSNRIVTRRPATERIEGGRRYRASTEAHKLEVTVLDRRCVDSMSGMPKPQTVEVVIDGRTLKGCAGDASALLRGGPWVVEQLGGQPVVARSRISLVFEASGRLQGSATCNRFVATYLLTGEGLTVTMPISTMRGCAPPLMRQEQVFLEALRGVQRFDLSEDGALVLHTSDGTTITARRDTRVPLPPGK